MDSSYGITAEHYSKLDDQKLDGLAILPPREPKDKVVQWVRGSIKINPDGQGFRDLVVTGPRLKVVYGGCKWNRLVFALPGAADPESYSFEKWINKLSQAVKNQIWSNPSRYKPGSTTNVRFVMDDGSIIRPSSAPAMYPDELLTRLSVRRIYNEHADEEGSFTEFVDADILVDNPDGDGLMTITPEAVVAGMIVVPIIKISYNRNNERFGLVLTVVKAKVVSQGTVGGKIDNSSWTFDDPMDVV